MATDINKAMKKVERKRNLYTKAADKAILQLYKKVGEDYSKKLEQNGNIDEYTLKQHEEYFKKEYERVAKATESIIKTKVKRMIKDTVDAQEKNINDLSKKFGLNFGTTFKDKFSTVNEDALRMILTGKVYKDNISISERIWNNKNKVNKKIAEMLAQKKHPIDISREIEQFVNPNKRKYTDAKDFLKVHNKVEYNALRLSRTYINHAYQEAAKDTSEANPFIKKLIWKSSHHKNMCGMCAARDGKEYNPKDMPLDHPNGMCSFTYKTDDLEDTAKKLNEWLNGKENKELDKWYNDNFGKSSKNTNKSKINKSKKEAAFKVNRDYNSSLGKSIPKADFDAIMDLVDNSKNKNAAKVWNKLYSKIRVGNAYNKGTAYSDYYGDVYFNIDKVRKGRSFSKPFNTIFHEFGHSIDKLNGISKYISVQFKDNLFANTIKKEVDDMVKAKQEKLKKEYANLKDIDKDIYKAFTNKSAAYNEIAEELVKKLDMLELGDISDILEGATLGKIQCGIGHGKSYWQKRKETGLAAEAFAEMFRANFAGEESLKTIQKYLPKSYEVFEEILEELTKDG